MVTWHSRAASIGLLALVAMVAYLLLANSSSRTSNGERVQPVEREGTRAAAESNSWSSQKNGTSLNEGGWSPRPNDDAGDWLSGCVVANQAEPISDLSITWTCLLDGQTFARPGVKTDENGCFRGRGCAGGLACVSLNHPTLETVGSWTISGRARAELRVTSRRSVRGTVHDAHGAAIPSVRVRLAVPGLDRAESAAAWAPLQSVSDDEGMFAFFALAPPSCSPCRAAQGRCTEEDAAPRYDGPWSLEFSHDQFISKTIEVDALSDGFEVQLAAATGVISGRVTDAWATAYPRATVYSRSIDRPLERRKAGVEAKTGRFRLEYLGPGEHEISVAQDGVEVVHAQAMAQRDSAAELALSGPGPARGTTLTVRIVDEDGEPWRGLALDGPPFSGQVTNDAGVIQASDVAPGRYLFAPQSRRLRRSAPRFEATVAAIAAGELAKPANRTIHFDFVLARDGEAEPARK